MKSIQIKITYDDGRVVELSPDVEVVTCMAAHAIRSLNQRVKFMDNILNQRVNILDERVKFMNNIMLRAIELVKVLQG
jgi:hypothetical protein